MRWLVGLLLTPLIGYPVLAGCSLLVDAWMGERFLSFYLRYEQRLLWDTFWGDYLAALPAMYAAVGVAVAVFAVARGLGLADRLGTGLVVALLGLLGWAGAVLLTGAWIGSAHLALSATGVLLGVPVAFFVGRLLHRTTEVA